MKLRRIAANDVKEAVAFLNRHNEGCYHFDIGETDTQTVAVCIGWGEYDSGDYRIMWKIGIQPFNSVMQCDFDVDWLMPYDKDGEVYDTSEALDIRNESDYRRYATRMNTEAARAYNFQCSVEGGVKRSK